MKILKNLHSDPKLENMQDLGKSGSKGTKRTQGDQTDPRGPNESKGAKWTLGDPYGSAFSSKSKYFELVT